MCISLKPVASCQLPAARQLVKSERCNFKANMRIQTRRDLSADKLQDKHLEAKHTLG